MQSNRSIIVSLIHIPSLNASHVVGAQWIFFGENGYRGLSLLAFYQSFTHWPWLQPFHPAWPLTSLCTFDILPTGNPPPLSQGQLLHILESLWGFAFPSDQYVPPILLYRLNLHPLFSARFKHDVFEACADPRHLIPPFRSQVDYGIFLKTGICLTHYHIPKTYQYT